MAIGEDFNSGKGEIKGDAWRAKGWKGWKWGSANLVKDT
jgi:hypothetical protein